ncbi:MULTISPECIES: hypothetical protein [unclassified Sphingomonas]|jgi:hypothetical protein|uniref:hypothetical protein n=1 Tax=unclassified Sphingomonas TaxID=196159 RepID=UPI0013008E7A|nr:MULTISPECIES: hypothetical protein [unclassified Sphingomonas]
MIKLAGLLAVSFVLLSAAKDDPLAGRVAGAPATCIGSMDADARAQIVDARTIVYSRTERRSWVVHPKGACNALQPGRTIVVEQRGAQLCQGDRFRTVQSTSSVPSGYCTFDSFTPYDKPDARR